MLQHLTVCIALRFGAAASNTWQARGKAKGHVGLLELVGVWRF